MAKTKPTGDPKRISQLTEALEIDGLINAKAHVGEINDPDFVDEISTSGDDEVNVVEMVGPKPSGGMEKSSKDSKKSGTVVTQAFRVAETLAESRKPRTSAATEALTSLASIFSQSKYARTRRGSHGYVVATGSSRIPASGSQRTTSSQY